MKKILLISLLGLATSLFAQSEEVSIAPTVECRFAALEENGDLALDEIVPYSVEHDFSLEGDFDPYHFEISTYGNYFNVSIYLHEEALSGVQLPIQNIIDLPVGASIFGINTVFHEVLEDFFSVRYECLKVL